MRDAAARGGRDRRTGRFQGLRVVPTSVTGRPADLDRARDSSSTELTSRSEVVRSMAAPAAARTTCRTARWRARAPTPGALPGHPDVPLQRLGTTLRRTAGAIVLRGGSWASQQLLLRWLLGPC
jgi:hypothetical protein